jgi:septal ring factor EnvC (AmiA/AmiB activator)
MEMSKSEFEKTLKSLQNEKAVLTAAVEARERKLDKFKEMKDELVSLKQKLQEKEKQCDELVCNPQQHMCMCVRF